MSGRTLFLLLWACAGAAAAGPVPLADQDLAAVRGADGIHFAVRLELNQPGPDGLRHDSRLSIGHEVEGRTTYLVVRNPGGVIQMVGLGLSTHTSAGGQQYMAIGLPALARFTDVGFDSLSVQADPQAPVTNSLGRFSLDGEMRMTGQLRLWSH